MSRNCIRCGKKERVSITLYCADCLRLNFNEGADEPEDLPELIDTEPLDDDVPPCAMGAKY